MMEFFYLVTQMKLNVTLEGFIQINSDRVVHGVCSPV
jgi:hypothetical protein